MLISKIIRYTIAYIAHWNGLLDNPSKCVIHHLDLDGVLVSFSSFNLHSTLSQNFNVTSNFFYIKMLLNYFPQKLSIEFHLFVLLVLFIN